MADNQTVSGIPAKRSRTLDPRCSQIVPCEECIQIQLRLIKAEGSIELLTKKCNKQAESINQQKNQIKRLEKHIKQVENHNKELQIQIKQIQSLYNVMH